MVYLQCYFFSSFFFYDRYTQSVREPRGKRERERKKARTAAAFASEHYIRGLPPLLQLANTMSGFVENFCGLLTPVFRVHPTQTFHSLAIFVRAFRFPDTLYHRSAHTPLTSHRKIPPIFPFDVDPVKSGSLNRLTYFEMARSHAFPFQMLRSVPVWRALYLAPPDPDAFARVEKSNPLAANPSIMNILNVNRLEGKQHSRGNFILAPTPSSPFFDFHPTIRREILFNLLKIDQFERQTLELFSKNRYTPRRL